VDRAQAEAMSVRTGYEQELELEDELLTELGVEYSVIATPTSPGDDRFRIRAQRRRPSTLLFPTNTICHLAIDVGGGNWGMGSGTLIAPQVVLTARHCLRDTNPPHRLYPRIVVTPGLDAQASPSLRRPAWPRSIEARSPRYRFHPTLDYGVIILPRPFQRPSRFMVLQVRSARRTATLLTIAGYPCDKPAGTMWGHSEPIRLVNITPTHLQYTIDTCPGHSGSPIWLLGGNDVRLLLGVHTNGPKSPAGAPRCDNDPLRVGPQCLPTGAPVTPVAGLNGGVRVTCALINQIRAWCRAFNVRPPSVDGSTYRRFCAARR
jgi:V8-like Glu-specific endopeptidase